MTNLEFTKEDANEAFFNLGKLMARLPLEEAKRMEMIVRIIASRMEYLEEKLNGSDAKP
jgi:hypothetical protein